MSTVHPRSLQGLKALVTGATSGLGKAIAIALAREGAEVVIHGRDAARGAETVEAIRAKGGSARFAAADLNDSTNIARLVNEVGEIDILVNNAGFSRWGPTGEFDVAFFDAMFAANVRAPFALVAAFAPGMSNHTHHTVPAQFVEADGIRFAYRRFGKREGVPLVFFMHFTGTMDHWDPAVPTAPAWLQRAGLGADVMGTRA